jgi:hypothetical protein
MPTVARSQGDDPQANMAGQLQVSVMLGGGQDGGIGRAGHDVAADQILDVVDHQIKPIRRQFAQFRRQAATTMFDDDARLKAPPRPRTPISAGRPHHSAV